MRLGSVTELPEIPPFDLLIGGSPCQDLSLANKTRQGLKGSRSSLFYKYLEIRDKYQPKYYILENVNSMSKEDKATITEEMGVEPVMLDASLVSAQSRKRLFWTNIPVGPLVDKGIVLSDILVPLSQALPSTCKYQKRPTFDYPKDIECGAAVRGRYLISGKRKDTVGSPTVQYLELGGSKVNTVTRVQKDSLVYRYGKVYKLHPIECERLQGLPDNYTEGISDSRRYQVLGNAFNVDVVAHILRGIK